MENLQENTACSFHGSNLLGTHHANPSPRFHVFPCTAPEGGTHTPLGTATPRANHVQQEAHQTAQLQEGRCLG